MFWWTTMSSAFITMTLGTLSSTTRFSRRTTLSRGSCSPFRDHADRNLGSLYFAHAWSLVNYVKFPVDQSLGVNWIASQTYLASWRGGTPVRSYNEKTMFFLCFCCHWLYSHLLEMVVARLLTGDAFDGRQQNRFLHDRVVCAMKGGKLLYRNKVCSMASIVNHTSRTWLTVITGPLTKAR